MQTEFTGKTAKGTEFTLRVDERVVTLTMPALKLTGETVNEATAPGGIHCLRTITEQKLPGGSKQRVGIPITPEIGVWYQEAHAEIAARAAAAAEARQAALRAERREAAAPVQALLPAGRLVGTFNHFQERPGSDGYGDAWYELMDGRLVRWDANLGCEPANEEMQGWYHRYMSIPEANIEAASVDVQAKREQEREAAAAARREAARQAAEKRRATAFSEAVRTGERQQISRHTDECHEVDCSMDIVTVWAMPDGTTQTERTHTY